MGTYPNQKFEKSWMSQDITREVVEWAESFGKYLSEDRNALTTGQLRKFYGEVKRIEANPDNLSSKIVMLKPLLAYAVGRDKNAGGNKTKIKEFAEEMQKGVDAVLDGNEIDDIKARYNHFVKIFEAVVAYHKFYGKEK